MATAAYITANAPNDNEHVAKLHAYVLEGVWVLQTGGVDERRATQHQDHTPVRHSSTEASRQRPLLRQDRTMCHQSVGVQSRKQTNFSTPIAHDLST
jgi:hypothetical protein